VVGVELFCKGVHFFENFTMCALNNFDVILENIVLDAYEVDDLHNISKLKIQAKVGKK
jgi:hypothetical protein